jgi:putative membrane protein
MKFIIKIILYILSNALAVFVAVKLVDGLNFDLTLMNLLKISVLLGLINALIKPLIKLISLPLIVLTLGLFIVVINIALLFLVSFIIPSFSIESLSAAFWGTLIISLVNYIVSFFIKD